MAEHRAASELFVTFQIISQILARLGNLGCFLNAMLRVLEEPTRAISDKFIGTFDSIAFLCFSNFCTIPI